MGKAVNRSELAECFGVALTTIDTWLNQGLPFISKPGRKGQSGWKIDLSAVLEWHRERERENALGDVAKMDEGEAKRRKLAAEAGLAELELFLKQKEAVSIADFESAWQVMIGSAKSRLLGIGAATGPELALIPDDYECSQIVHSAICEALQELSESSAGIPDNAERPDGDESAASEADDSVGAATGTDGKRVGGQGTAIKPGVERKAR